MKAAVITKFNTPWELKTVPDPKPAPGQVLIKIEASGMCGTDVHVHRGYLPVQPPIVAGHEPVGKIVEVGAGETGLKVGDRVGVCWAQKGCGRCAACQSGRIQYCQQQQSWMNLGGGNSELMLAWAGGCTLLPDGVSSEEAAPLFCAGYTVMSGFRNAAPRPGERIAVLGLGGLGHIALQIAKALGHETVAVTGTASKSDELRALGADHVVVSGADAGKALMDIGGADVILSTTNSAAQASQALNGLRAEGRLINMGVVDGPLTVTDGFGMMLMQRQVMGSTQNRRSDLVEVIDLLAAKKIKPRLETYPIAKINDVLERQMAGKVRYRAVLTH